MVWDMLTVADCLIPVGLEPIAKMRLSRTVPIKDDLK